MTYGFLPNFNIKGDKEKGLEQIVSLANAGNLTPDALVDANRPEDAPLHKDFEWDDKVAAEEYRRDQARYIIRSVSIVTEEVPSTPIRAYYHTDGDAAKPYQDVKTILRTNGEWLLRRAYAEMMAFREKYKSIDRLNCVINQINVTLDELKDELEVG